MSDQLLTHLEKLVVSRPPEETLLLMPTDHPLFDQLDHSHTPTPIGTQTFLDYPPQRRYPLAILVGTLDTLSQASGDRLIASLRDLYADTIYCLADSRHWPTEHMIALGLRPLTFYPQSNGELGLYYFDLYDYKRTPNWLNPKYWAHPERWDKDRW